MSKLQVERGSVSFITEAGTGRLLGYDRRDGQPYEAIVTAVTNPDGGIRALAVPVKKQWLTKCPFGRLKSVAAGANHTSLVQTVLESHTDWIQIGIINPLSVDITGVKICVAPSTTLGADNSAQTIAPVGGSWVNQTIGGAASGTLAAGVDANSAKITWFDPMAVSTLDRADGGVLPVLLIAAEVPAANANRPAFNHTTTGGWESENNTDGRIWRSRTQSGLFATAATVSNFTNTAFVGDCLPILIRYIPRHGDGMTVYVAGDSVHEGSGASPDRRGFPHIAACTVSSMTRPIEICQMSIAGATSAQYAARVQSTLADVSPDVVLFPAQTPNNVTPPTVTASNIVATNRDIAKIRAACQTVGALPILTTGAPWLALEPDPTTLSEDFGSTISLFNAHMSNVRSGPIPVVDTEFTVRAGYDADGQSIFATGTTADGLHLSPVGQRLASVPVADLLRRVIF